MVLAGGAMYTTESNCRGSVTDSMYLPGIDDSEAWRLARACLPAAWSGLDLPGRHGVEVTIGTERARTLVTPGRSGWTTDGCYAWVEVEEGAPHVRVSARRGC